MDHQQKLEVIRSNCPSCKKYAPPGKQELGHPSCSSHRDCTGKSEWLPDRCRPCVDFREAFTSLSGAEQHRAIADLKAILRKTHKNRGKYGPWSYMTILKNRFPDYYLANASSSSAPGSPKQRDVQEHRGDHTSPTTSQPAAIQDAVQHQSPAQTLQMTAPSMTPTGNGATGDPSAAHHPTTYEVDAHIQPGQTAHTSNLQTSGQLPTLSSDHGLLTHLSQVITTSFHQSMGVLSSKLDIMADLQSKRDSRLDKFLSSKRARSHSSSRAQSSSSGSSSSGSSRSRSNSHSRSPTPNHSTPGQVEQRASEDAYFVEDGHIWLWITKDTEFTGSKVKTSEGLTPFIRHTRKSAYRTVATQREPESPFMGTHQALDTMISFLCTQRETSDKVGPSNRSFRGALDDSSHLGHALRILLKNAPKAIDALYRNDTKEYAAAFPSSAFDAVAVINYTTGWHFTRDEFKVFASGDFLDLNEASRKLEIRGTIWVPKPYLVEEKNTRIRFLEYVSNLGMLEGIISKVEPNSPLSEALKATSRHSLSFLKDYSDLWYRAKFLVRRIALQYTTQPIATRLLCSNMWEASLFGSEAITDFLSTDVRQEGTMKRLDIDERVYASYKSKPDLADPKRHTDDGRSKSRNRGPSASRRGRRRSPDYAHERRRHYADWHSSERNIRTSRPNKRGAKRQRVSFREQRKSKTPNTHRVPGSTKGRGPHRTSRRQ